MHHDLLESTYRIPLLVQSRQLRVHIRKYQGVGVVLWLAFGAEDSRHGITSILGGHGGEGADSALTSTSQSLIRLRCSSRCENTEL